MSQKQGRGGYGDPPRDHQFKPGHKKVGGRRKKPKPEAASAEHLLDRKVQLVMDGKPQDVTIAEAVMMKQVNLALQGDTTAAKLILKIQSERPPPSSTGLLTSAPTIIFSTFNEGVLAKLGVLGADPSPYTSGRPIETWVARAALERAGNAYWEQPNALELAIYLAEPMELIDRVPEHLHADWIRLSNPRAGGGGLSEEGDIDG